MKKVLDLIMITLPVLVIQQPVFAAEVENTGSANDSNATASSEAMMNDIQAETEMLDLNSYLLDQKVQRHLSDKKEEMTLLEKIQTETRELFVPKPICFKIEKHEPINARRLQ